MAHPLQNRSWDIAFPRLPERKRVTDPGAHVVKFPSVSWGYLGIANTRATLASAYYGSNLKTLLEPQTTSLNLFPQRVPVTGFFEELIENETEYFAYSFAIIQKQISQLLKSSISGRNGDVDLIFVANMLDLAARFGLLEEIERVSADVPSRSDRLGTLVTLKLHTYLNTLRHSRNGVICTGPLTTLYHESSDPLLGALILARLVVSIVRYGDRRELNSLAAPVENLLIRLDAIRPTNVLEQIWLSMINRALPMHPACSIDQGALRLERAEFWALSIPDEKNIDLIRKELLITTDLTRTKHALAKNAVDAACARLRVMVSRDPFDTVGYAEIGHVLYKHQRWAEAFEMFKTAADLGPPSLSMTEFYAGECARRIGNSFEVEYWMTRSMESDRSALSPRLALIDTYREQGQTEKVARMRKMILASDCLKDQLAADELLELTDV